MSAVIVNSKKGLDLIKSIKQVKWYETKLKYLIDGNPTLIKSRELLEERSYISSYLKKYGLHKTVVKMKPLKRKILDAIHGKKSKIFG